MIKQGAYTLSEEKPNLIYMISSSLIWDAFIMFCFANLMIMQSAYTLSEEKPNLYD